MIDSIQDVPGAFIGLGWRALGLLAAAGGLLTAALSLLFVAVTTDAFSWLTVAALVGAIFGALIAFFAVFAIRRAFGSLREYFDSEAGRLRKLSDAVVLERSQTSEQPKNVTPPAPQPTPAIPELQTASTNQANKDFTLALNMFAATLQAASKEKDGEKVEKPFTYDAMHEAGFVQKWEDWRRILDLWESAGLVMQPRARAGWRIDVQDIGTAEQRLISLFGHNGYVRVNGSWVKR